jgi:hypothetical protein
LQANYYDNSDTFLNTLDATTKGKVSYAALSGYDSRYLNSSCSACSAKGLLVGTRTKMLDDTTQEIVSAFYYDAKGRLIQQKSTNLLGGSEVEYYAYSFTGQPTKKQKIHTATGKSTITEIYTYAYDHAGRPTTTKYKLDSNAEITLSELTYDELGRVNSKKLHGGKETIAYSYNIRNWMKALTSTNFKETLYYNESYAGNTLAFNGNISAMSWSSSENTSTQAYRYTYDGLNRMKKAQFLVGTAANDRFTEEVSEYDKHGNIKQLKRYALNTPAATSGTLVDNLTLTYTGNQIKTITDAVSSSTSTIGFIPASTTQDYIYNKNGALTCDYSRGISGIQYNVLNLPEQITFSGNHSTLYSYDATGMKRRIIHTTVESKVSIKLPSGSSTIAVKQLVVSQIKDTTDYCGHIVYENGALKYILTPEGYIMKNGTTANYNYYLFKFPTF